MNAMTLLHRLCFAGGLSLVLLSGCDPQESSLGDLPETESESGLDSEETSDSDPTDSNETGSVEGSVVGQPCEPTQAPFSVLLEELPSEACGGGYCLYANAELPPASECTSDEVCGGTGNFYCDPATGQCALNPAFVAARSMCTQLCETADDCIGAEGTTCEGGFSCEPLASLGALCCQSVCVCNDDLDVPSAGDLRESCERATTAGCCDQNPPGLGCG